MGPEFVAVMKKNVSFPDQATDAPARASLPPGQGVRLCPPHILARYRALLTVLDEAVIMADAATGIIVDVNEGAVRLLDLPKEQIIGRHHTFLHPPQENDRHAAMFKDAVAASTNLDGLTTVGNVKLCRRDGTIISCEVSNILVEDEERPVIIGLFRDRTPQEETEKALQDSERRFRLLVENTPDAIFLHDMSGTILDVNRRASDMTGYAEGELRRMKISQVETLCPPETLEAIWDNVRPGVFSLDGMARRKDGSNFPAEIQGVVFTEQTRSLCLVAVRDMTSRKDLEQSLVRALERAMTENREKCVFLASISHEIRTPLNVILGMAELLRRTPPAEERQTFLDTLENSCQVLLRLVNDILDLSRIEADTLDLRPVAVDLQALLREAGEIMRVPIEDKGLVFRLTLPDDLPPRILVDPDRLRQVLMNLLWNAHKFTAQGGITLEAQLVRPPDRAPFLRFAVSDTGIGIPADQLERIFLPFTQTAGAAKDGAGLGLAISKRLVERMGGRIWVESQPGSGSRFFFSLPLVAAESKAVPEAPEPEPAPPAADPSRTLRVLVVEDNPANQELLRLFLEKEPIRLTAAASGSEALALFADQPFDCVLMDVELSDMDGFEITAAMRKRERETGARPTPVVILTGYEVAELEDKGRQAGCDGLLSKPIRRAQLLDELARVTREAAAPAEPDPGP